MNKSEKIGKALFGLWGALGAYRGHKLYNKDYQNNLERYNNNNNNISKNRQPEPKYYAITNVTCMALGTCFYMTPFLTPFAIYLELSDLEDIIRNRNID